MSFGFGVGDIINVITLANRLRKSFSSAPEEFRAISLELKNCSLILQEIDVYLEGHGATGSQETDLSNFLDGSQTVLSGIEEFLNKHTKVADQGGTLHRRTKRIWQRVTWDPEDIHQSRNQLQSVVIQLNGFMHALSRRNIATLIERQSTQLHQVTELVTRQELQIRQEVLDWLSPSGYAGQHNDHVRQRLPDTGLWFLKSDAFKRWRQYNYGDKILMLSGVPGAGKTVLSSIIIDSLQEECNDESQARLCYYYCDYNTLPSPTVETIWSCFLRQLVQSSPILPDMIRDLYDKYRDKSVMPPFSMIRNVFMDIVGRLEKIYIVVDALDESSTISGLQKAFLSELSTIVKFKNVHILVTTRPLPNIRHALGQIECIETKASEEDILLYVEANIKNLPAFVGRQLSLQNEIKHSIVSASDGIFLLATLCTRSMMGTKSPRQLRKAMESFVHGAAGYNRAYSETMNRIAGQIQPQKELAIDALTWTAYGERLLTVQELLPALATEPEEAEFHEDNIPDIEDVLNACCGLVILEQKTNLVRLVHRTAQEFFKSEGKSWLPEAHTRLSTVCNTYLNFVSHESRRLLPNEAFKEFSTRYPLYNYASMHWWQHVSQRETMITVQELVSQQPAIDASSLAFLQHLIPKYLELCRSTPGITGLHLIAYHGLAELLPSFLEKYDINSVDDFGNTPILYAVKENQDNAARILIENGAKLDIADSDGLRPLSVAIRKCYTNLVLLLLDSLSDPMAVDGIQRSPLHFAAGSSNFSIIRILLDRGCDPRGRDKAGCSPLIHAIVYSRDTHILQLLIDRGADPLQADAKRRSPLSYAMECSDLSIQIFFLELISNTGDSKGIILQASSIDADGWTPFMYAAKYGHSTSLQMLSDSGATIDDGDVLGRTPLMVAILSRATKLAMWLLELGADPNYSDMRGCTVLMMAAERNLKNVMRNLMDRGADINAKDVRGRNVLHIALRAGVYTLFDFLLQAGTDPNTRDAAGRGILEHACLGGCPPWVIVKCLEYQQPSSPNDVHSGLLSALHLACQRSNFETLSALVDAGLQATAVSTIEPPAKWTPIDVAIYCNNDTLITANGTLIAKLPWKTLISSGIVKQSEAGIEAFRGNFLGCAPRDDDVQCDYCELNPAGFYYTCLHCVSVPGQYRWDLCIFCKPAAEMIHPGHEWRCREIEAGALKETALGPWQITPLLDA